MQTEKIRDLGHRGLPFQSPLRPADLDRLSAELPPAPRILDLGCGDGAMLAAILAATGGTGVGVDLAPGTRAGLDLRTADFRSFADGSFDVVMCVGALPDDRAGMLRDLHRHAPRLLLGELVRLAPMAGPLASMITEDELDALTDGAGWVPVDRWTLGPEVMVPYEEHWLREVATLGPSVASMLAARRAWLAPSKLGFRVGRYRAA